MFEILAHRPAFKATVSADTTQPKDTILQHIYMCLGLLESHETFSFVVCEGHGSISQQNKQIFNISNAPNILISTVSCGLIFVIAQLYRLEKVY